MTFDEDPFDRYEPGFTLGGPIASTATKTQDPTDQYLSVNITARQARHPVSFVCGSPGGAAWA